MSDEYVFIKIKRCELCYLRQHLPNMMNVLRAQPRLEKEVIEEYNLCVSPIVLMKNFIWTLEEAARNMDATPPEKARFS